MAYKGSITGAINASSWPVLGNKSTTMVYKGILEAIRASSGLSINAPQWHTGESVGAISAT